MQRLSRYERANGKRTSKATRVSRMKARIAIRLAKEQP